jgi:hypothetical protein
MNKSRLVIIAMSALLVATSSFELLAKKKVDCTVGTKPMVIIQEKISNEEYQELKDAGFTVTYNVNKKGEPKKLKVKKSGSTDELTQRMLKSLKKWRFRPHVEDDKVYYQVGCELTLKDKY